MIKFDGEDRPARFRVHETVTGMTSVDGTLVAGTHRGSVMADDGDGFGVVGSFDVPADTIGRYSPLCWVPI